MSSRIFVLLCTAACTLLAILHAPAASAWSGFGAFEAESMNLPATGAKIVTDAEGAASGGTAVLLSGSTEDGSIVLRKQFAFTANDAKATSIAVTIRTLELCGDQAPKVALWLDGKRLATRGVGLKRYHQFHAALPADIDTTDTVTKHAWKVVFVNPYANATCSRKVLVDYAGWHNIGIVNAESMQFTGTVTTGDASGTRSGDARVAQMFDGSTATGATRFGWDWLGKVSVVERAKGCSSAPTTNLYLRRPGDSTWTFVKSYAVQPEWYSHNANVPTSGLTEVKLQVTNAAPGCYVEVDWIQGYES